MKSQKLFQVFTGVIIVFMAWNCTNSGMKEHSDFYLTDPAKSIFIAKQESGFEKTTQQKLPTIKIEESKTFQKMDGFGFSLTGGSAFHIFNMSKEKRSELLNELFRFDENNIGISYLRISLGASDLDAEVFSYDNLPAGETDVQLEHFSLDPDKHHLIPVLKEILTINPEIKIMASPWSPPVWMKTNQSSVGGSLKPEFYTSYANYFVKYVQEMQKEGISIDAITVQNEPLHPGNNPSLLMLAKDQAVFVKDHLGPAFESAEIKTKIIIYDHNADRPDYPISILNDQNARKYIDGSAFHLYGGVIENLSQVHEAHPDKHLYFTEQWIGEPGDLPNDYLWHTKNLIIGASRNWCRTVLEWNLAANSAEEPHTPGGCDRCLGALTIDGDQVIRNPAYYIVGQVSKFVRPGSVRIDSNVLPGLPNVAFKTPDNKIVIVVLNSSDSEKNFAIQVGEQLYSAKLANGAGGTFIIQNHK